MSDTGDYTIVTASNTGDYKFNTIADGGTTPTNEWVAKASIQYQYVLAGWVEDKKEETNLTRKIPSFYPDEL